MLMVMIVLSTLWSTIYGTDMMKYPGDINIGALFSIREAPVSSDPSLTCGKIREVHGIQKLEAALYIRDEINNDAEILPGITLGMEVRDTCWSETLALRQSLCLVGNTSIINIPDTFEKQTKKPHRHEARRKMIIQNPSVIGVIGPSTSEQSIQVQNLLKLLNIPQIGYSDTTPELDNRIKYPTFMRVVPCDSYQTTIIRDLLIKFNWTYVATVHTRGVYGEDILSSFRKSVEPKCSGCGVCIAKDHAIERHYNDSDFDDIIHDLNKYTSVNVIISFCEREALRELFKATKRLNLTNRFTFISSDGWEDPHTISRDVEEQAWGTIFVLIHPPRMLKFKKYYTSLKPSENTRNPWFKEFWEDKFNCTLPMDSVDKKAVNRNDTIETSEISVSRKLCTGNESLAQNYYADRSVAFVFRAVTIMAYGLHKMIIKNCGRNYIGLCPKMYPFDTSKLVVHLLEIINDHNEWTAKNINPRYDIQNFQKLSDNKFKWITIGDWINGTLKVDKKYQDREYRNITSICSSPCPMGHQKTFASDNKNQDCCWDCKRCGEYEYVSFNKEQCIVCPQGERPNATLTGCDKVPATGLHWFDPIVIMIVTFIVTGLISTFFTLYVFIKYKNTPIVKASNRDLCYLILVSMILAHISVFAVLAKPTPFICTLSRTIPAIGMTMMYACLFTETYRIARILANSKKQFPEKKRRFISTSSQIAITFFCVAIETAICFAIIVAGPSAPMIIYQSHDHPSVTCSVSVKYVIPPLVPIALLHGLCIIYTIKTRNVAGNFNEANFMGFAMLISSIIFIVFITVFFGTPFQALTLGVCQTLIPSFTLIFLFFPKLYIIIFKPEKNNSALLTTNRSVRSAIKREFSVNISEPIFERPVTITAENNFATPGHSCRLRKSVAVQTSSKLRRNELSSDDDDDESFSDDDDFDPNHDNDKMFPNLENSIVATVSEALEKNNYSSENTCTPQENLTSKMTPESLSTKLDSYQYECETSSGDPVAIVSSSSCVKLNVDNLPKPENNRESILSQNIHLDLDGSENLPKDENQCVQQIKLTRIHEEPTHEFHNGDPVFKITITLGTESSENFDSSS